MHHLLIADDHPVCSAALTLAARVVDAATTIDNATTLAGAEEHVRERTHDLILLDLMLPDVQGFAGLALVKALRPDAVVAIVSSRDELSVVQQSAALGAAGFLSKTQPIERMVAAIRVLLEGGQWWPEGFVPGKSEDQAAKLAERLSSLSTAQLRVLRAIASGHQNKQIAYDLNLAEATVKSHLAAIFRKLGVTNRTQAVVALRSLDAILA
ncbi:DNA-binding response regulator [Sphingomonas spermidinifaciens]|uniref:DNA-binding response regulator n=1 Tax=Sphingomonas spermidinifaciens TaxID=1141889 RepID=A0A2A4B2N6_9SPHN|nr:response regulator transcription factor [Sphingomonas spermidinifaciens]PCD02202.1 DNA-binding response regulator [Sphingomonas spermidinifaciens]